MDMTKTIKYIHMQEEDVVDVVIPAPIPHMLPVVPKLLLSSFPIVNLDPVGAVEVICRFCGRKLTAHFLRATRY